MLAVLLQQLLLYFKHPLRFLSLIFSFSSTHSRFLMLRLVRAQIDASLARLITPTIGFSNFAFRIASGFVAFKFREYTTYICGGGMFFGGFAVFVSAFYGLDVVWFQFLYAVCYGIAPGKFNFMYGEHFVFLFL